jgi:hypothetical protein
MNEPKLHPHEPKLVPRRPPGRSSRKARAFAEEIGRLRAEGYTYELIREALADAGVIVGLSTVHREVTRWRLSARSAAPSDATLPPGQPTCRPRSAAGLAPTRTKEQR